MAIYGYTKNYKLIKPQFNTDTWHDYIYDNLDTIDAVMSAIYASGNWKGFWAKNMTYVAGDVIIDQDTDTMYKVMIDHVTSANTFAEEQTAHPDYYELWSPNNLAESWAIKTDGKVSNTDYSAKAYAISSGLIDDGSAKEWAIGSGAIGNTNEYSAKKYATDAHNDYISLTTDVNVVAVGSNIANVNTVGQSISDVNTVASNVSSVNTVAGVSTDVTAVAGIASSVPTVANNSANVTTVATNISDVNTAATNIEAIKDAPNQATNAANSATASANSATSASASAQAAQDAADKVQGLIATPIGTIFQSVYVDESLDIARQLNGQLISSTKFTGFRSWLNTVQTASPNLFTTETNWQAEKTNSKLGQCGKFVVDDTAGTIRLPCVVNAQGLVDLALIGAIKAESLPNITGSWAGIHNSIGLSGAVSGTFKSDGSQPRTVGADDTSPASSLFDIDASRSSSTYQDNAPVQQEAVQYPYYIQVATGIEETLPAIREYKTNVPYVLGDSKYFEANPYNASWLASNGQYNSATVYPDMWSQLQVELNSSLNVGDTIEISGKTYVKRGLPVKLSTDTITDYDFVVNQNDQTFRLPLLNGSEDLPGDTFENITYNGHGSAYTATKNGTFCIVGYGSVTDLWLSNKTAGTATAAEGNTEASSASQCFIDAKKGDIVEAGYYNGNVTKFGMSPATGNGTLYYYVGDTVQDASLINAGAVLGQLSNKADIDASNFNADGKSLLSGLGMPSSRYIDLTLGASGSTYTAPANGYMMFYGETTGNQGVDLYNSASSNLGMVCQQYMSNNAIRAYVPCKKGDIIVCNYTVTNNLSLRFVYAEGDQ